MKWIQLLLLRVVWAQERIADGARGARRDANEIVADMFARDVADREERFAAAAGAVFVRLLSEGNFSECQYVHDTARQEDWDRLTVVISRHREFAHLSLGDVLTRAHMDLGEIDGDFWRADTRMSDEDFWRLGEALLAQRQSDLLAAGLDDDSEDIRDAWRAGRVLGRGLPERYARSSTPAAAWPDNKVIFGSAVPPRKPKP